MASSTRTVTISLVEQNLGKRTYYFYPRLSSADGDVVLNKVYKGTTNASGDATIALPTKASGTITYDYRLPTSVPGVYSEGTFHLSAGSAIDLEDLIAAGGVASDTVIDYVDERTADAVALGALFADLETPGTDGQKLVFSDDVIIYVSETYRRLDTEFGVVADDSTNNATAIQTALNSVRDAFGGTLVFPNGITKINGNIVTNFNTKRGQVKLMGDGGKSVIHITGGAKVMEFQNAPQVIVEGLTFVGTPGVGVYDFTQNLLFFNVVEQAIIRDCRFLGLAVNAPEDITFSLNGTHGIVVAVETTLLVEACHFQGNGTVNCPNIGGYNHHGMTVRDTLCNDFGYQGNVTHSKTPFADNHYWIRAFGGLMTSAHGFPRSKVMVERSHFDEGNVFAIFVEDCQWVELNNVKINTGISSAINLENVRRARFNDVFVMKANNPGVISLTATDCDDVELNNLLHYSGVTTIQLLGTTKRATLRGCTAPGVLTNTAAALIDSDTAMPSTASAAALAPKAITTHVTGTTNVTSITATNFKPGDVLTLIFDGVLTFTHGNNIKLAGAANFTTAADSMIVLKFDGTNFYEQSRKA